MSWPYWPDWPNDWSDAAHTFTLQISSKPDCSAPVVNVTSPLNFYNALPALKGAGKWYWRVGYDVGADEEKWSDVRSFGIAEDAVVWDRAALAEPDLAERGHPRILFTKDSLAEIRSLAQTNAESRAAMQWMREEADTVLAKAWWGDFPETDRVPGEPEQEFYRIAGDLALVAFVWRMTGDDKYSGVIERAVTWASYAPRGRASPEGLGGDGNEDATQGNEFLALLFDWLYEDLTDQQRRVMIESLEWRIDHWMNSFAWRGRGRSGPLVRLTYRSGDEHLGDERLYMGTAAEWKQYDWRAPVPEKATSVSVELFNYYARGTVWWDGLEVRLKEGGPTILEHPTASPLAEGAAAEWRFHAYDTGGKSAVAARGGREGGVALGIACASSRERGSWGRTLSIAGQRELYVTGWYRTDGAQPGAVRARSLSGSCSSHQYEGSMDTAVCGLALYEHSDLGREWFELILNYLIGITNGFGYDEAWNEGAGYGTSKCKWLMNATPYFDTALPEANLGRNPYYRRIGDWFCRIIPVGMDHHAWGNQRNSSRGNHIAHMRKFAYITGEGRFLLNWQQYGGSQFSKFRAWIEYVLPFYYEKPTPEPEKDTVALFPIAGWGMAATGPPSLRSTYDEGAGVIFQCRPRGGYSHSFNSDGSFQLHAYGEMLNHGGGSSANQDAYAYHTMSHNTILVDGLGQAQPGSGQLYPNYGRVVGFSRGDDYVYFAGDATRCYPKEPGSFRRWGLPLDEVYERSALQDLERFVRHILFVRGKYFVIYDDLSCGKPATYTWLYHILPDQPLRFDPATFAVDYSVGDVKVRLQQIARPDKLKLDNRKGLDGFINPFTGEDYREWRKDDIVCGHNLWISSAEPAREWSFLAVVYPEPPGGEIPRIERIDDSTVRVGEDTISFDPSTATKHGADFVVDVASMRGQ
jgi:hypothetical protein